MWGGCAWDAGPAANAPFERAERMERRIIPPAETKFRPIGRYAKGFSSAPLAHIGSFAFIPLRRERFAPWLLRESHLPAAERAEFVECRPA